jgi:hypothetical protein
METPEGVFITPQQVLATNALDSIVDILRGKGHLLSHQRYIRTRPYYGNQGSKRVLFEITPRLRYVEEDNVPLT